MCGGCQAGSDTQLLLFRAQWGGFLSSFRQEAVIVIGILKRMVKEKGMECTVARGFSRHQRILETQKMQDVYVIQVSKNKTLTV